ncbi:MAG: hypothetical protein NXY57DRAFT_969005 [Lentinula lateritia]|nr:MAG: hypothetical protein NXY57DRAFT_969005 [Lentinula lateritia]
MSSQTLAWSLILTSLSLSWDQSASALPSRSAFTNLLSRPAALLRLVTLPLPLCDIQGLTA